jgi:CheY-like chemotaxis protein
MPNTVLIVDDEKNIRRTVRMVLEGEGWSVEEASSGEEALARLPDIDPDVILLDVQMQGMSGLEALEQLRKTSGDKRGPTVVMISGHATLADAVRAVKAGAYDFLEKPLDRERLIVTLRNALERRRMAREVEGLRELTEGRWEMVGKSPAMTALYAQIAKVAPTRTRVLITGESGTGQGAGRPGAAPGEHPAQQAVREGELRAIPPELIESELFGHERGAFTGASARKKGPVRDGRRRHHLPRRGRGHDRLGPGQGAARAAVGGVHPGGRRADPEGRCAGAGRPPTAICRRRWRAGSSARTSTSGWRWCRCGAGAARAGRRHPALCSRSSSRSAARTA